MPSIPLALILLLLLRVMLLKESVLLLRVLQGSLELIDRLVVVRDFGLQARNGFLVRTGLNLTGFEDSRHPLKLLARILLRYHA